MLSLLLLGKTGSGSPQDLARWYTDDVKNALMVINSYLHKGEFIVFDLVKPEDDLAKVWHSVKPAKEDRGKAEAQCEKCLLNDIKKLEKIKSCDSDRFLRKRFFAKKNFLLIQW